jgi:hypothetical protein
LFRSIDWTLRLWLNAILFCNKYLNLLYLFCS